MIVLTVLSIVCFSFNPNKEDWDEIKIATKETFGTSNFDFNKFKIEGADHQNIYFTISSDSDKVGYLVIGEANSQYQKFDFYVLYDTNASILKVEVLNYIETYGFEICNKHWLKQFISARTENIFEYNKKIDGISGATISVSSIKHEIFVITNKLKNKIKKLL